MADTVEIRVEPGPAGTRRVPGQLARPGLLVHESYWGVGWTVSHAASGKALVRDLSTEQQALDVAAAMEKLSPLAWDASEHALVADLSRYVAAIYAAVAEAGAEQVALVGGKLVGDAAVHPSRQGRS